MGRPLAQLGGALRPRGDGCRGRRRRPRPCRSRGRPAPTPSPASGAVRGAAWPDRSPRPLWLRDTATCRRSTPVARRRGPGGWARSHGCAGADPRTAGLVLVGDRHQTRQPHQDPSSPCAGLCTRVYPACAARYSIASAMAVACASAIALSRHVITRAPHGSATHSWARRTSDRSRAHRAHRTRARTHRWAPPRHRASAPPPRDRPPHRRAGHPSTRPAAAALRVSPAHSHTGVRVSRSE